MTIDPEMVQGLNRLVDSVPPGPRHTEFPTTGTSLLTLPGLGPKTVGWLAEVGITDAEGLRAVGAVEAYRRVRMASPRRVSKNALWALHAALLGIPWTSLNAATKAALLAELDPAP